MITYKVLNPKFGTVPNLDGTQSDTSSPYEFAYVNARGIVGDLSYTPIEKKAKKFYKNEEQTVEDSLNFFKYKFEKIGTSEDKPKPKPKDETAKKSKKKPIRRKKGK